MGLNSKAIYLVLRETCQKAQFSQITKDGGGGQKKKKNPEEKPHVSLQYNGWNFVFLLPRSRFEKNKVKLQQRSFSHVLSCCYETAWGRFHNFLLSRRVQNSIKLKSEYF